jgi:hypothetical protein
MLDGYTLAFCITQKPYNLRMVGITHNDCVVALAGVLANYCLNMGHSFARHVDNFSSGFVYPVSEIWWNPMGSYDYRLSCTFFGRINFLHALFPEHVKDLTIMN